MELTAAYTQPDGTEANETFTTIPEGAYAALGVSGDQPGHLFICRLCQAGTSLISLHHADGRHARTAARHAGKTLRGGRWAAQ